VGGITGRGRRSHSFVSRCAKLASAQPAVYIELTLFKKMCRVPCFRQVPHGRARFPAPPPATRDHVYTENDDASDPPGPAPPVALLAEMVGSAMDGFSHHTVHVERGH
jgi:hypothetical protein